MMEALQTLCSRHRKKQKNDRMRNADRRRKTQKKNVDSKEKNVSWKQRLGKFLVTDCTTMVTYFVPLL